VTKRHRVIDRDRPRGKHRVGKRQNVTKRHRVIDRDRQRGNTEMGRDRT